MERPKGLKDFKNGGSCILGRTVRDSIRAKGASVRESHKDLEKRVSLLGRATSRAAVPTFLVLQPFNRVSSGAVTSPTVKLSRCSFIAVTWLLLGIGT